MINFMKPTSTDYDSVYILNSTTEIYPSIHLRTYENQQATPCKDMIKLNMRNIPLSSKRTGQPESGPSMQRRLVCSSLLPYTEPEETDYTITKRPQI